MADKSTKVCFSCETLSICITAKSFNRFRPSERNHVRDRSLGLVVLATATLFVPIRIEHPLWMMAFLVLTAATFCLFGFIIGIWAKGFEQLQFIPMLVITPLTFLGGAFYSIDMLPPAWRTASLFNPNENRIFFFPPSYNSIALSRQCAGWRYGGYEI